MYHRCWDGRAPFFSAAPLRPARALLRRPAATLRRPSARSVRVAAAQEVEVDVAIVGAGVIGLCAALVLLQADRRLSVALLDRQVPCSGATGAGQGYLWLAHRDPSSPLWDLAVHSKRVWEEWLEAAESPALTLEAVEYQPVGSMLIASTAQESAALAQRQQLLAEAGVRATHVESGLAARLEPALSLGTDASALLVPDDLQINGRKTAAALQAACEAHGNRFRKLFYEGVEGLAAGPSGRIELVQTQARRVRASRGVVLAAGAWSGDFLAGQLAEPGWGVAVRPRKGLLLEMARPEGMPEINRGLMEMGYTKHYDQVHREDPAAPSSAADITFTATTSASGTLLVGSSREFGGFETTGDPQVVDAIMQRAVEFLPGLRGVRQEDISVRAGPRPFATRGLPLVGPVPGADGLLLAAGHEGSGLTLGPATAQLLCHHLLGEPAPLPQCVVQALLPRLE